MSKIALVIGHNARSKGAVRTTDGVPEYDWNTRLAEAILACQPNMYRIFRRSPGVGEIGRVYAEVLAWGPLASIELHFNSFGSASATGTETLTSGSPGSLALARKVQAAMVGALGLKDRSLVTIGRHSGGRGEASLHATVIPAILLEPYFGSNPGDCAASDRHFQALARAIHGACVARIKEV